jgi:hypothetical protein
MPDTVIYTRLTTHSGLIALIGTRTYPAMIPANPTYPLCVYLRVSDVPQTSLDWTIQFREARYQVSCYATSRKSALAIAEQVIAALHGYVSGTVKKARFENLMEIVEPGAGPNGVDLYHVPVDFMVTF